MKITMKIRGGCLIDAEGVGLIGYIPNERANGGPLYVVPINLEDEGHVVQNIAFFKQFIKQFTELAETEKDDERIEIWNSTVGELRACLNRLEKALELISKKRADIELYGANPSIKTPNNLTKENQ